MFLLIFIFCHVLTMLICKQCLHFIDFVFKVKNVNRRWPWNELGLKYVSHKFKKTN